MRRHDFEPGKLVIGLVLLGGSAAYLAAAGRWHFPAYVLLPALGIALCVSGAVSALAVSVRRRRELGAEPGNREPGRSG